ncbi:MAG: DUF3859 domain-containing protein [Acidobacteriota bacterium]
MGSNRLRLSLALAVLVVLCGAISVSAQVIQVDGATITEYGLYAVTEVEQTIDREDGGRVVDNWRLTEATTTVPATLGTSFGFQFVIEGKPVAKNIEIGFRLTHPEITDPESGRSMTVQQWKDRVDIGAVKHTAYAFSTPWEVSPGDWTFEVFYGDKKLCNKTFTVVEQ